MAVPDDEAQLAETVAATPVGDPSASTAAAAAPAPGPGVAPGATVGRYRLRDLLGAGAMGEVWAAYDPQLDRKVAVKLVHPRVARSPEVAARMMREARAMAKLSHRAVVAIHDAGEADGQLFLAMELVRGRALGAVLRARTPEELRDWRRWLGVMLEAGRGLAAAHEAGVLHRDFKPDNVLVEERGRVCVGDFGLASLGDHAPRARVSVPVIAPAAEDPALTTTGAVLGTPAYMSLEQLYGEAIDARADQFSFCVATWEALYGERPFAVPPGEHANLAALIDAIERGALRPPPPGTTVPAEVRAALVRGLAARAADRWADLDSLLAALARALAPLTPRARRRRGRVLAVGALGVALAGLGAAALLRDARPAAAPPAAPRLLQPVSTRAALALSPGGRLAIATERIQIQDLAHPERAPWVTAFAPPPRGQPWATRLQFESDDVVLWAQPDDLRVERWAFGAGAREVTGADLPGRWLGSTPRGILVETADEAIALVDGARVVHRWPRPGRPSIVVAGLAPGRQRLAYLDAVDLYTARIVVLDVTTLTERASAPITGLTALAWRTDHELLYGTRGAQAGIYAATLDAAGVGAGRLVLRARTNWIGAMTAGRERVIYTELRTQSRARILADDPALRRDFEPAEVAAVLGWRPDGKVIAWNRSAGLEIRDPSAPAAPLRIRLERDVQSATQAGELLIVTLRGERGREIVAYDLTTADRDATPRWRLPEAAALTVRCAGDLAPPCFAALRRDAPGEQYAIVRLDPATGARGEAAVDAGALDDFAVDASGARLVVAASRTNQAAHATLREYALAGGGAPATREVPMPTVRSVAFGPGGRLVVAGTIGGNKYAVLDVTAPEPRPLVALDGELLLLVRPAPDGQRVAIMGRDSTAELYELRLPPD